MREYASRWDVGMRTGPESDAKLAELRRFYEPYVQTLGERFRLVVPDWSPERERLDNWKTSAWQRTLMGEAISELHQDGDG